MIDNGLVVNVWSHRILTQLQEKGVEISPLEEDTLCIRAYDSSSKNPLGIITTSIT